MVVVDGRAKTETAAVEGEEGWKGWTSFVSVWWEEYSCWFERGVELFGEGWWGGGVVEEGGDVEEGFECEEMKGVD